MKRIIVTALLIVNILGIAIGLVFARPGSAQDKGANHVEKKANNKDGPSKPLASPPVQLTPDKNANAAAGIAGQDVDHRVRIDAPVAVKSIKDRWDKFLVIFTGIIIIVGSFQIYFLWKTVRATSDNAKAARDAANAAKNSADTLKALERADVLLASVFINRETQNERSIVFEITNFGRSRATHISVGTIIRASTDPARIDGNYAKKSELLAPDQTLRLCTNRLSELFTQDAINQIWDGLLDLRFTGHIAYDDVFEDRTTLEFNGMYNVVSQTFTFDQKQTNIKNQNPN